MSSLMNSHTYFRFLILLLCIPGCSQISPFSPEPPLRSFYHNLHSEISPDSLQDQYTVLTFNIQLGFTHDQDPFADEEFGGTEEHLLRLVEGIQSIHPDIVILQEVAEGRSNTEVKNQLLFLAQQLEMNYAYADDGERGTQNLFSSGMWGNAILSKLPIRSAENHSIISIGRFQKRSCLLAELEVAVGIPLGVMTAHLINNDHAQVPTQFDHLLAIADKTETPKIIGGDFNFTPDAEGIIRLRAEYNDSYEEVHGRTSGSIYYLLVEPLLMEVEEVGWLEEQYNQLSDHPGYFAKIKLK